MASPDELRIEEGESGVRFSVRVAPRASRAAITGVHGGALKVSLTAPPVEGAANAALIDLLSSELGVAKRAVRIAHGDHSRLKALVVSGISAAQVRALVPR